MAFTQTIASAWGYVAQYGWYAVAIIILFMWLKSPVEQAVAKSRRAIEYRSASSQARLAEIEDARRRAREQQQRDIEAAAAAAAEARKQSAPVPVTSGGAGAGASSSCSPATKPSSGSGSGSGRGGDYNPLMPQARPHARITSSMRQQRRGG